ncbi:MAG: MFS transporter [Rhodospirillaceae bacterium]|nr:MFS transporter [Rhodospirillaceae bacterium]
MSHADLSQSAAEPPYPPPAYAWYVVAVLMLGYVFAFLDRQILALLVQPIKRDLGLSDTEISLLLGLAFAVFYTLLGIPIGRLADRANRRTIVAAGIAVWSLMTMACGLARGWGQLFLARVGVGIGEATLQPCASSLLGDYFPRGRRGLAYSVYAWGLGIGAGLSFVLGGRAIEYFTALGEVTVPVVGTLAPWQMVFVAVGAPGLIVALLMLTVAEPARRDRIAGAGEQVPLRDVVGYLTTRWRTYGSMFLGLSVMTIIGNAYVAWMPSVFVRVHGWSIGQLSLWYGVILGVGGPIGVTLGGWLGDQLYRRGVKDGHMRAAFYGVLLLVPTAIIAPLIPDPELAMAVVALNAIGAAMPSAAGPAALMMATPNQMRGQVTAVYWFVISLLGLTIGPTSVALITDFVFADENAVGFALSIVSAVAGLLVTWVLVYNLRHFKGTVEETEMMIAAAPVGSGR